MSLGRYLHQSGRADIFLDAFARAVELAPAQPPSAERAEALATLGNGLMLAWRHDESLAVCEEALVIARAVGARPAEVPALTVLGVDLAYLGRGDEGLANLRLALQLAEENGDPMALERAYVNLTDALMMLGRLTESSRLAEAALDVLRPYGMDHSTLAANRTEALLAMGEWDEADSLSAAAVRAITANYPHMPLLIRSILELGRGDFDAARTHIEAARATVRSDRDVAVYDGFVAELALWERRWTDADEAVRDGLARVRSRETAQIRLQLCAKGLHTQAELAGLARARRDGDAARDRLGRARELVAVARAAAAEAATVTPNAAGWLALAEAEYQRARGESRPAAWSEAAATWDRLERPPLAAYCRWRQAEALVATGASRAEASGPLRQAHDVAARIGARPLAGQLELLAQRARLELASPDAGSPDREAGPGRDPRPHAARGRGPRPRRPWLHQPRDRGGTRYQRQDGRRSRLAHPAQARRAEPARGGRHRPPLRPAARPAPRVRRLTAGCASPVLSLATSSQMSA